MDKMRDYYDILGVDRSADVQMIKRAYRKLAKKYHPDTNKGNAIAEEKFKEATEAYAVLSDPQKKKEYDECGHKNADGSYREYHFEEEDLEEILKSMFGFRRHTFREDGRDLRADINISFDEAVSGCEKIVHITDGDGKRKSLKVKIPAGIDTGQTIRLRGKGMPGRAGGYDGDLLLNVKVGTKAGYERKEMDIYTKITIPFTAAALGGEVIVPTVYGKVLCTIHPGTQSGTKIRLRGKGIVSMKNNSIYGDQYVTVQIEVPRNLSTEAKKKLKEYEEVLHQNKNGHAA